MDRERYDVNNIAVSSLLSSIKDGSIDIAAIFDPGFNSFGFVIDYFQKTELLTARECPKSPISLPA